MRLQERLPETRHEVRHKWLIDNVQQGRIVTQGRGGRRFFLVLQKHGEKVTAMRDDGQGATFALSRVNRIYQKKYPLTPESLEVSFDEIEAGINPVLDEPRKPSLNEMEDDAAILLSEMIENLPPRGLSKPERNGCLQLLWEFFDDADFLEKAERDTAILRNEIWLPFENRARVLDYFGYLDFAAEKVTDSGRWLADVRVDRPLLFGEALKNGFFTKYDLPYVVAFTAAITADSDRSYGELQLEDDVLRKCCRQHAPNSIGIQFQRATDPLNELSGHLYDVCSSETGDTSHLHRIPA